MEKDNKLPAPSAPTSISLADEDTPSNAGNMDELGEDIPAHPPSYVDHVISRTEKRRGTHPQVSIRLDPAIWNEFKTSCRKTGRTIGDVLEVYMKDFSAAVNKKGRRGRPPKTPSSAK